jgi:hypothetical protein
VRNPEGAWGEETPVETDAGQVLSGPQAVLGANDVVHLAYTANDGTAWYSRIMADGTLSPREQLASGLGTTEYDVGSIVPLVFVPEMNTVVIVYRQADGRLWERRITGDAPPTEPVRVTTRAVVQNAVDSDQVGADAVADGTTVHVLFIEESTGTVYHTYTDGAGVWQPAVSIVEDVNAQWLRGRLLVRDGGAGVYGFVYDAGSDGGSGMNKFRTVPLGAP